MRTVTYNGPNLALVVVDVELKAGVPTEVKNEIADGLEKSSYDVSFDEGETPDTEAEVEAEEEAEPDEAA